MKELTDQRIVVPRTVSIQHVVQIAVAITMILSPRATSGSHCKQEDFHRFPPCPSQGQVFESPSLHSEFLHSIRAERTDGARHGVPNPLYNPEQSHKHSNFIGPTKPTPDIPKQQRDLGADDMLTIKAAIARTIVVCCLGGSSGPTSIGTPRTRVFRI